MSIARSTFNVAETDPTDCYKLTTGLVVPRPIGWIGTYGEDGVPNLAPYSFFQAVATNPPVVLFSTGVSGPRVKDSLVNVRTSGVFTASLVSHSLARAMNETAAEVDPTVDEFALAGVTPERFGAVEAPGVAEANAILECRVVDEKTFGDSSPHSVVTFGEVVAFHIADAVLDGTRIDAEALDALGRLSGTAYAGTRDRFSLDRPA